MQFFFHLSDKMYSSTKAMKKKTRVVKIFECQKMLQRNRVI